MTTIEQTVRDTEFQNWLKGGVAMLITKQGLEKFVEEELITFQTDILQSIYSKHSIAAGTVCTSCTTENVLHCPTKNFCVKKHRCNVHDSSFQEKVPGRSCPKNICHHIPNAIRREHRYSGPSWKNTNAKGWCTHPVEIAKCYLPPEGYATVESLSHADFNATLSVVINKKSFEKKIQNSVCSEAREIGNKIRHSSNLRLSNTDVGRYITVFMDLLSDAKHLAADKNAKEAVTKLKQLKANTLTVTTTDITAILDDSTKAINTEQHDENKAETEIKEKLSADIKTKLANMQTVSFSDLGAILAAKTTAIEQIRKETEHAIKTIEQERENQQSAKKSDAGFGILHWCNEKRLWKRLCEDLITYYRRCHSTIPVSPLIKEHDAPLVDFYVQPTLESVEISGSNYGAAKRQFRSYNDLFLCDKEPYKEIYVTAKAGIGKTSFSKKVCMTWSQAHSAVKQLEKLFHTEDTSTLKKFDFLFMISLKEAEKEKCTIDDMISLLVKPWSNDYTKAFIEKTLREKRVLIILDGLDEWAHPENCTRNEVIPHRRPYSQCTVMTTTRPWKLASARLSNNQIDMQAELLQFDEASSNDLVVSAVRLLNRTFGKSKSAVEFQNVVSSVRLGALKRIPYILLQILCLWFDGLTIGKSQCEIYSNTLELTLSRKDHDTTHEITESIQNGAPPACMSKNIKSLSHYNMLLKLGRLAFETLTSYRNESTLIFDDDIVYEYLSDDDLNIFLNVGLLSQNKDYEHVTTRRSKFSFQHKSIQEYFAALYIQSDQDNTEISSRLLRRYNALESILEMTNILIFLGGFSPDACEKVFQKLKPILLSDKTVCRYRSYLSGQTSLPEARKCWELIKSFQFLETDILQEITRNGHTKFPELPLYDIVLDSTLNNEMFTALKLIVEKNKESIRSLSIEKYGSTVELTEVLEKLELQNAHSLLKLEIAAVPTENDFRRLLANSVDTLICLDICFAIFKNNKYRAQNTRLSSETIAVVFRMNHLQSARLNGIRLPHTDIQALLQFFSDRTSMKEIGLCRIRCVDHVEECSVLDLSQHKHLETLRIGTFPVSVLNINPSSLNFCYTGSLTTTVHTALVKRLPDAVNLSTLRLKNLETEQFPLYRSETLTQLPHLRSFAIEYTDIGERDLTLPPEMKNIERVYFYEVTMTSLALEGFIRSVDALPQPVLVIIEGCSITPESKFRKIKDMVRSTRKYRFRFDTKKRFTFETRKTEDISVDIQGKKSSITMITGVILGTIVGLLAVVFMFYLNFCY
ncbi:uncharacterized protein LOC123557924 [Mercenaria mercenaria]|uniref:uncharacterized protein LOC123557924 n=1 Tax=Mercenaria mercenaria TaxID=6596 RepID=UPI00234E5CA3|nr:uncharacterized protein LOC123557924 [Mercenaria mercenaria]